jgi:hypothetical protein
MKAMPKDPAFKHSARAAWRKVDDEAVILDVETAVYYSLGGSGLMMWELLGERWACSEIVQILGAEYDVDSDKMSKDLAELAGRLRKEGLLEPGEPRGAQQRPPRDGRKKYRKPELVKHGALCVAAGQIEDCSE